MQTGPHRDTGPRPRRRRSARAQSRYAPIGFPTVDRADRIALRDAEAGTPTSARVRVATGGKWTLALAERTRPDRDARSAAAHDRVIDDRADIVTASATGDVPRAVILPLLVVARIQRRGGAATVVPPASLHAGRPATATRFDDDAARSVAMDGRPALARAQLDERGLLVLYAIGLALLVLAFLLANL